MRRGLAPDNEDDCTRGTRRFVALTNYFNSLIITNLEVISSRLDQSEDPPSFPLQQYFPLARALIFQFYSLRVPSCRVTSRVKKTVLSRSIPVTHNQPRVNSLIEFSSSPFSISQIISRWKMPLLFLTCFCKRIDIHIVKLGSEFVWHIAVRDRRGGCDYFYIDKSPWRTLVLLCVYRKGIYWAKLSWQWRRDLAVRQRQCECLWRPMGVCLTIISIY